MIIIKAKHRLLANLLYAPMKDNIDSDAKNLLKLAEYFIAYVELQENMEVSQESQEKDIQATLSNMQNSLGSYSR